MATTDPLWTKLEILGPNGTLPQLLDGTQQDEEIMGEPEMIIEENEKIRREFEKRRKGYNLCVIKNILRTEFQDINPDRYQWYI